MTATATDVPIVVRHEIQRRRRRTHLVHAGKRINLLQEVVQERQNKKSELVRLQTLVPTRLFAFKGSALSAGREWYLYA